MEGYKSLACAVIQQAVADAKQNAKTTDEKLSKTDAIDFLKTKRLDEFIVTYQLDLNAGFVRKALRTGRVRERFNQAW